MAFIQYLNFNGVNLPLPDSYDISLSDVEADSKLPKLTVRYFDTQELETKETEMYISGYKASLEKDTSYKGLWTVNFTLNEM